MSTIAKRHIPVFLFLAGLFAIFSATPALAQNLPSGSYWQTCSNVTFQNGILSATCKRSDGSMNRTELTYAGSCNGNINNVDGNLVCNGPIGNFQQNCRNIQVQGDRLYAQCQASDGRWIDSNIQFSGHRAISNCNGILTDSPNCDGVVQTRPGTIPTTHTGDEDLQQKINSIFNELLGK